MASIILATSDFLISSVEKKATKYYSNPTIDHASDTYRDLDLDPLLVTLTSCSCFFSALAPRLPRYRCLNIESLRLLAKSPTFTYALELHLLLLQRSGIPPIYNSLTSPSSSAHGVPATRCITSGNLDFLKELFPQMIQVRTLSFSFPCTSSSTAPSFYKHHSAYSGGDIAPTNCGNALHSMLLSHFVTSMDASLLKQNNNNNNNDDDDYDNHSSSDDDDTNTASPALESRLNIFQLLSLLPSLEHLSLRSVSGVKSFYGLLHNNVLPLRLRSLDLSGASSLKDDVLGDIIPKFKNLNNFYLANYYATKDESSKWNSLIAHLAPKLVCLDLKSGSSMPIETFESLSECSRLQYLNLGSVSHFHPVWMRNFLCRLVLQGCHLKELSLTADMFSGADNADEEKEVKSRMNQQIADDDQCFLDKYATATSADGQTIDPCPLLSVLYRTAHSIETIALSKMNLEIPDSYLVTNSESSFSSNQQEQHQVPNVNLETFPVMHRLTSLQLSASAINTNGAKLLAKIVPNLQQLNLRSCFGSGAEKEMAAPIFLQTLGTTSKPPLQKFVFGSQSTAKLEIDLSFASQTIEHFELTGGNVQPSVFKSLRDARELKYVAVDIPSLHLDRHVSTYYSPSDPTALERESKITPAEKIKTIFGTPENIEADQTEFSRQYIADESNDVKEILAPINFEIMYHLSQIPSLSKIRVSAFDFTDDSLKFLADFPKLETITLTKFHRYNITVTEKSFTHIFSSPSSCLMNNLKSIFVRDLPPHIQNLSGIGACKSLTVLRLMRCTGLGDQLGHEVALLPNLTMLLLRHNDSMGKMLVYFLMETADKVGNKFETLKTVHFARCLNLNYPMRDPRVHPNEPMTEQEFIAWRERRHNNDDDDDYGTLIPASYEAAAERGKQSEGQSEWKKMPFAKDGDALKDVFRAWRPHVRGIFR